ncbi:Na+/H+ antiporter subunit E [Subtercola boreus]|uniref:Na+/H+ antiporter subunit E n=1 Tax=Subtercola boreus TaxID=120213 RepID=A0A3E0WDG7_9MICO|nr:Na+/H+ antiporter subunit E [Subtercola boreus]RFA21130.1 Na+/H+ antiporter subunit E [Subtercola boreus]RFA21513.1 Na+/H+ antiporter subunit E [Subtercola boreus]RFA27483.1 Na+/H+ antiporter subunit E [Subtercola boreus]
MSGSGSGPAGSNGSRSRLRRARLASGLIPFLGLVLLWMLLWGQFTWLAFATGLVLAFIVSVVFYLPAVRLSGRFNGGRALLFLGRLIADVVVASVQIAWSALNPGYRPSNAILTVQLATRSDLLMTFTAVAVGLVPGSIVLDIDRDAGILHLHALNVASAADVPALKRSVSAAERRLILAMGSADDLARLAKSASMSEGRAG